MNRLNGTKNPMTHAITKRNIMILRTSSVNGFDRLSGNYQSKPFNQYKGELLTNSKQAYDNPFNPNLDCVLSVERSLLLAIDV